jgi:hypothetical protein
MNRMKKCLSISLSLCLSAYALPGFAMATPAAVKTILSDEAMAQAVGGNMEAQISETNDGDPNNYWVTGVAMFAGPGPCIAGGYALEVVNDNGTVYQTLDSGTVPPCGVAFTRRGIADINNNPMKFKTIRLRVWNGLYPELTAQAESHITANSSSGL